MQRSRFTRNKSTFPILAFAGNDHLKNKYRKYAMPARLRAIFFFSHRNLAIEQNLFLPFTGLLDPSVILGLLQLG